jgi:pyrroloquinoline quinone (PQQ) biosynthesis protein C
MSFYDELQLQTKNEELQLQSISIIQQAVSGNVTLNQYVQFLTQAYHHVKHTVPLLMLCGSRVSQSQEWLREAVAHYIEDELGHQEWILNDIAACGVDADTVRHGQPSLHTEVMVAYAYDTIARVNPVGFFGMVYVLEGTSVQLATNAATNLESALSLPNSAFSYLNSHGSLDLEHIEFLKNLVNKLEGKDDKKVLIHSAKAFFQLYGNIFRSLEVMP